MKCFVISPFAEPFNEYYRDIVAPAARSLGLDVVRADEIYGVRPIMDDIVRGIVDADVIIAEVTTRNSNVNYELGMAHALGKPVVIISQSTEDIPFDYKHVRAIIYDTKRATWAAQLKKKLIATIQTVVSNPGQAFLHKALEEFHNRFSQGDSWGLSAVFNTRQEMNIRLNALDGELQTQLDICAFGLKSFRDAKNHDIRQKVKNGLKMRILSPNPDSLFLAQREFDEKVSPGEIRKRILDLIKWVKQLREITPEPENVVIKVYDALPLDFYWRLERWLFVGPYLYGRGSQQTITYEFVEGGRGYDYFSAYFNELWEDEEFTVSAL
jgi:nucleoside 2-deoxyribosyltransferase